MMDQEISGVAVQNEPAKKVLEKPKILRKRKKVLDNKATALYRYFDADGMLLYVGVSLSVIVRAMEHRRGSRWFRKAKNITIEWFYNRREALRAECVAICRENPRYNITHLYAGIGDQRKRMIAFAAKKKDTSTLAQRLARERRAEGRIRNAIRLNLPYRIGDASEAFIAAISTKRGRDALFKPQPESLPTITPMPPEHVV